MGLKWKTLGIDFSPPRWVLIVMDLKRYLFDKRRLRQYKCLMICPAWCRESKILVKMTPSCIVNATCEVIMSFEHIVLYVFMVHS